MSISARLFALFAVIGAPLAWVGQLVFGYTFEDVGCSPADGAAVWSIGVGSLHIALGSVALVVSCIALACAVVLRLNGESVGLAKGDRTFLGTFGILSSFLFGLTIVLTGIGSTYLGTCHAG